MILTTLSGRSVGAVAIPMRSSRLFSLSVVAVLLSALASCSSGPPAPNPKQTRILSAKLVNPHPRGSYAHFTYRPYPSTTRTWKNDALLARANRSNTKIRINLSKQRGFLLVDDQIAMDYRISTGGSKYRTPTGAYQIIEKTRSKSSNLYGKIRDATGKVVMTDADTRIHTVPEGGTFEGASMPYWMRLTRSGIGMHQGDVKRTYASHGCIRTHSSAVPIVYAMTSIGTPVKIVN